MAEKEGYLAFMVELVEDPSIKNNKTGVTKIRVQEVRRPEEKEKEYLRIKVRQMLENR